MHRYESYILPGFFAALAVAVIYYLDRFDFREAPEKSIYMMAAIEPSSSPFGYARGVEAIASGDRGFGVEFAAPDDGKTRFGRIIAVAGDVVEMREDRVLVNGSPAREAYASNGNTKVSAVPMIVPRRTVFVLNDARGKGSSARYDSRYYGPIPIECVRYIFKLGTESSRGR